MTAFTAMLTGPVVWAAHLTLLYGGATLACLTPEANESAFRIFAAAATLAMIGGLVWFIVRRLGMRDARSPSNRFNNIVAIALAAISILAMLWTALPVAMIGHCAA